MKKTIIIFFALFITFTSFAQERTNVRELGLFYSGKQEYGLTYRFGTDAALWRVNVLSFTDFDAIESNSNQHATNLGLGVSLGKEYRKRFVKQMAFRYGAEVFTKYSSNDSKLYAGSTPMIWSKSEAYTYGIHAILGLAYQIEHFVVGIEILPSIQYQTNTQDFGSINTTSMNSSNSGICFDLDSAQPLLSVAYRF